MRSLVLQVHQKDIHCAGGDVPRLLPAAEHEWRNDVAGFGSSDHGVSRLSRVDQIAVGPLNRDHLFMGTALHYPPPVEHQNLVAIPDGAKTMRHDHTGAPQPA